jgi:hypothetical protein
MARVLGNRIVATLGYTLAWENRRVGWRRGMSFSGYDDRWNGGSLGIGSKVECRRKWGYWARGLSEFHFNFLILDGSIDSVTSCCLAHVCLLCYVAGRVFVEISE